ncbi:MAG: ClpXP protease specificity-enhancing factor SspB [Mariprofundaceae bacterium]|nr:ClpXP protease specificity-enhancing factor SspB [Mariprofundaceae bacterium]
MTIQFSDAVKSKQLRKFFQEHGRIYIVVDATRDDICVPDFLKGDPALRLVLNNRMPQAIYIRDDALSSEFSFSGKSHHCHIPMAYIWAAYQPDGDLEQGLIWENSVPETIRIVVNAARGLGKGKATEGEPAEIRDISGETVAIPATKEAAPKRKTRHLHVVK